MQKDGDLVACRVDGDVAWHSGTTGDGASLVLQDDGDLAITVDGADAPL